MTYKYIKFTDSQTMRSLEKVAIDKGWIKPKEIVKEASIDEKILVSENMDENFANLIIGLKKAGFKDLSNELQHNFIEYKKAESKLYDLENNPGEDLINKAHPGKSPNIGKGELSLIESLYEQHEKMMDAVNSVVKKKANIKTSQQSILSSSELLRQSILNFISNMNSKLDVVESTIDNYLSEYQKDQNIKNNIIQNVSLVKNNLNGIDDAISGLNNINSKCNAAINIADDIYNKLNFLSNFKELHSSFVPIILNFKSKVNVIKLNANKSQKQLEKETIESLEDKKNLEEFNNTQDKLNKINSLLSECRNILNEYDKDEVKDELVWLNQRYRLFMNIKNSLDNDSDLDSIISSLEKAKAQWSSWG